VQSFLVRKVNGTATEPIQEGDDGFLDLFPNKQGKELNVALANLLSRCQW
jgi:hypothetical protein